MVNDAAIVVRSALLFQMLSIVELGLESAGSLACQKLIQEASWASIARRPTLLELIHRIMCTACNLCVDLLGELLAL